MKNSLLCRPTMHIHPSSPNSSISEDNAAIKIQANFRGYRVRKQMKDTPTAPKASAESCAKRGSAGGDHSESSADVSATKIQAGIRGYLVRKKQKLAANAATIIQANFRGFKTRQALKNRTGSEH